MRRMDESPRTDAALVAGVAAGDAASFSLLVERHHARIVALASRILMDGSAAEDIVQEAFLRLWRRPDAYDPARGAFSAWIKRVVVNLCLDRKRMIRPVEDIDTATEAADDRPTPEQAALANDRASRLQAALHTLPARQRAALALFYVDGMSMTDVAAAMETQPKAVESLLSRGRAHLKTLLTPLKEAL